MRNHVFNQSKVMLAPAEPMDGNGQGQSESPNSEPQQPDGYIALKEEKSDKGRLSILEQISHELANNPHELCQKLSPLALERAQSLLNRLAAHSKDLERSRMHERHERKKQRASIAALNEMVQNVWSASPYRFKDDDSANYYQQRFGLSASGIRPKPRDINSLIKYARQILGAEAEVVAAGYAPCLCPPQSVCRKA